MDTPDRPDPAWWAEDAAAAEEAELLYARWAQDQDDTTLAGEGIALDEDLPF